MNYIDEIAQQVKAGIDARVTSDDSSPGLLRIYALLALTTGTGTTLENVHDAWAAWRIATRPDHPDLVPFRELPEDAKLRDLPYAEAIRDVAARLRKAVKRDEH